MIAELAKILPQDRLIEVVDVGAAEIRGGDPVPYLGLVEAGLARVTGFEPNPEAHARLKQTAARRFLPSAVGDGSKATLNITKVAGFSSTLKADPAVAPLFGFEGKMSIVKSIPFKTVRLDDFEEITHVDFLKIDIQGGETKVFKGGKVKLSKALAVQTEVAFMPFYLDQPGFADQDRALQAFGLQFFGMKSINRFPLVAAPRPARRRLHRKGIGPWLDGDALYLRHLTSWPELSSPELRRMILLLAGIGPAGTAITYAARLLVERGDLSEDDFEQMIGLLSSEG